MPDNQTLAARAVDGCQSLLRCAVAGVRGNLGFWAVTVFAVGFLSPLLSSGFYCDDVLNSCNDGVLRMNGCGLGQWLADGIRGSMASGRFFPLMIVNVYTVHALFPVALAYKCYILALVLLNLVEMYYLLRLWGVDRVMAQLGTLTFVLLLQMRAGGDPILCHAGSMQFLTGQLLVSMICLQKYLASERVAWLVGSIVVYATSLLNYEVSYAFFPVFPAMVFAHSWQWRRTLAIARPYAIILATLTAFTLGLRYQVPLPADNPYQPNPSPAAFSLTAVRQASSAMPLSYALLSDFCKDNHDWKQMVRRWDNWAVFAAAGALTWLLLRSSHGACRPFRDRQRQRWRSPARSSGSCRDCRSPCRQNFKSTCKWDSAICRSTSNMSA